MQNLMTATCVLACGCEAIPRKPHFVLLRIPFLQTRSPPLQVSSLPPGAHPLKPTPGEEAQTWGRSPSKLLVQCIDHPVILVPWWGGEVPMEGGGGGTEERGF